LWRCHAGNGVLGRNGDFDCIALQECRLGPLNFETASVAHDVLLGKSEVKGEVRFPGAVVGGQFNCDALKLENPGKTALFCDGAKISGSVRLRDGFQAQGAVRFLGAHIGGRLICRAAKIQNKGGHALFFDVAKITGSVFLTEGFEAEGEVRFPAAQIGGDVYLSGGAFRCAMVSESVGATDPKAACNALSFARTRIAGVLWFGRAYPFLDKKPLIDGSIDLQGAQVTYLVDDPDFWPTRNVTAESLILSCYIHLDGFCYEKFIRTSKTDWKTRKAWLDRQRPSHLGEDFRPQPFEQLAKVLREMGHDSDARRIGHYKQSLLQKRRKLRSEPMSWIWGLVFGLTSGYGYRSHRLFVGLLAIWFACAWLYSIGAAHGGFAPKDPQIWTNADYQKACDANWMACGPVPGAKVSEINAFNAFTYSADMLLPAIDLGQRTGWVPMWRSITVQGVEWPAGTLRAVTWAENILGVSGVILIGAIVSGLIKRD